MTLAPNGLSASTEEPTAALVEGSVIAEITAMSPPASTLRFHLETAPFPVGALKAHVFTITPNLSDGNMQEPEPYSCSWNQQLL